MTVDINIGINLDKEDNEKNREETDKKITKYFNLRYKEELKIFKEKMDKLEKEEKKFISGTKPFKGEELSEHKIEEIAKTPMCLNLPLFKRLNKYSLITILLQREKLLFDTINQFNDSLKQKDRTVFKTLQNRVKEVEEYLFDKSKAYRELFEIKEKMTKLKCINEIVKNENIGLKQKVKNLSEKLNKALEK